MVIDAVMDAGIDIGGIVVVTGSVGRAVAVADAAGAVPVGEGRWWRDLLTVWIGVFRVWPDQLTRSPAIAPLASRAVATE
jgi:hypothetical protein